MLWAALWRRRFKHQVLAKWSSMAASYCILHTFERQLMTPRVDKTVRHPTAYCFLHMSEHHLMTHDRDKWIETVELYALCMQLSVISWPMINPNDTRTKINDTPSNGRPVPKVHLGRHLMTESVTNGSKVQNCMYFAYNWVPTAACPCSTQTIPAKEQKRHPSNG